jgi:hypothetical protein
MRVVRFGFPNDEVVHGHPCGADLMGYRVHIIHESPWLQELRQIEAVHPQVDEHVLLALVAVISIVATDGRRSPRERVVLGLAVVAGLAVLVWALA